MKTNSMLIVLVCIMVSASFIQGQDTLYYDQDIFDDGLGFYTTTGIEWPDPDSTYGFAYYFILSEFGLSDQKVVGLMINIYTINVSQYDYRLYIWETQPSGLLPKSEGPHLYQEMNATFPAPQVWGYYDLTSYNIMLPDTFWVGVCYNHFATTNTADWYLSMATYLSDPHMYLNDMDDGSTGWVPGSTWGFGYPYGVRIIVEDASGVGEQHVLEPTYNSLNVATINKGKINVEFTIANTSNVELAVYDVMGRKCKHLISENMTSGSHSRSFDLGLTAGTYFIRLETEAGERMSRKFVVCK